MKVCRFAELKRIARQSTTRSHAEKRSYPHANRQNSRVNKKHYSQGTLEILPPSNSLKQVPSQIIFSRELKFDKKYGILYV